MVRLEFTLVGIVRSVMTKINEAILHQMILENMKRLPKLSILAAVFGMIQLSLLFRSFIDGYQHPYKDILLISYGIFSILGIVYAIISAYLINQKQTSTYGFIIMSFILFSLSFGLFFSLSHANWMGDITAYSLALLIMSIVFYMPQKVSAVVYILHYLVFFLLVDVVSLSSTFVLTVRINALFVTLFALFINRFLSNQFKLMYEQTLTIQSQANQLRQRNEELRHMAYVDPLTGFMSRQRFAELFQRQLDYNQRYDNESYLLLIDVDDFKRYNDTYGHLFGDDVLIAIANRLSKCLRESDVLGRWGGDEFIILLPSSRQGEVLIVRDKIIEEVTRDPIQIGEINEKVSLSIGVSRIEYSWEYTMEQADKHLYRSKSQNDLPVFPDIQFQ